MDCRWQRGIRGVVEAQVQSGSYYCANHLAQVTITGQLGACEEAQDVKADEDGVAGTNFNVVI